MERLTENYLGCNQIKDCGNAKCEETCKEVENCDSCPISKAIDKLAEYEQAEEDGLLIRLPCKPGDKAYVIESHRIYEGIWYRVGMLEDLDGNGLEFEGYVYYDTFDDEERADIEVGICVDKNNERLGKTIFLTKAEAEQALAKMKGE